MRWPRPVVTVRWIVAVLAVGGGVFLLAHVLESERTQGMTFGTLLLGLGAIITGIVLTGPEMVGWMVKPIHHVLDSVFMPSESGPPPVDFTLARFYVNQSRYEEACEEYVKIIHFHPEQTAAYLEGIQAAAQVGDEEAARKFYRGAQRIMRSPDQRVLLENLYAARHELLVPAPEEEGDAAPPETPALPDAEE